MPDSELLARLVSYLREQVPMTRHFGIEAGRLHSDRLTLKAPLSANTNDKQTAFAGTLATLCTLSGWAMTSVICDEAGCDADIAVIQSEISYLRPCTEDWIIATCERPEVSIAETFIRQLRDDGRAEMTLTAEVESRAKLSARFTGRYSARRLY